jgi:hypothetical protein
MVRWHFNNCKHLKPIETPEMRTNWEQTENILLFQLFLHSNSNNF